MQRTVSQAAAIVEWTPQRVKTWAWRFRERLSPGANPSKGEARRFEDEDIHALVFVAHRWNDEESWRDAELLEEIGAILEGGEHLSDAYRQAVYLHTPILQEPPEGLDETWTHGSLYAPSFFTPFELARNYRRCAEALLRMSLRQDEALDLRSPVLFAYRHALELYLKVLGGVERQTHSLRYCLEAVERRLGAKMRPPFRGWILELDEIDPGGTSFRYDEGDTSQGLGGELWIDYRHFHFAMGRLFHELDMAILNDRACHLGRET